MPMTPVRWARRRLLRHQQSLLRPTLALLAALPLVSGVVTLTRHDSFEMPAKHIDRVLSLTGTEACQCTVQCRLDALCMGVTVVPAPSGDSFECWFSSTFLMASDLTEPTEANIVTYRKNCDGITYECVDGAGIYLFDVTPSDFPTAKASCPAGSVLASLSNMNVFKAVGFHCKQNYPTTEFWVDIERTLPDDIWTWGDGTVETASPGEAPWAIEPGTGQLKPDSATDLHARMRYLVNFLLDDKRDDLTYGFICQPIM